MSLETPNLRFVFKNVAIIEVKNKFSLVVNPVYTCNLKNSDTDKWL